MRVIAGTAKGVHLIAPKQGTRPTTDRVREAVFSVLADWANPGAPADSQLEGFGLLDLFSGSAAVAVEAASRGAAPVVAVDSAASAVAVARQNARAAGVSVSVVRASAASFLKGRGGAFDVIWLDPPYEVPSTALADVLAALPTRWLSKRGQVVVERSSRTPEPRWPAQLAQHVTKHYGETVVYFAHNVSEGVS